MFRWNSIFKVIATMSTSKVTKCATLNQGSDIQPTRYPTQVSWKGCRRLEDGNMEIEVDVDSVRHVPSYPIKFTKNKIEHQVKSIKELGIIQDCEITSVTNQFKEHWQTSVEKMGTKKEPETEQPKIEQTDISPDEIDAKLKTETKDSQTNLTETKIEDDHKEPTPVVAPVTAPPTNRFTIQTVTAKEETIAPIIDKPIDKPVIQAVPQTPVPQVPVQPGRFTINTVTTKKPPVQPQQAVPQQQQQQVPNQPVIPNEPDKSKVDGGTQTGDEGGNSSLDKVYLP